MLSEFSSAAHTSCARSYRRSIGAVISNVYALRTAKPNYIDDISAATETQGRCEVSCCSAAEQLRGFDVSGPLQQKRPRVQLYFRSMFCESIARSAATVIAKDTIMPKIR